MSDGWDVAFAPRLWADCNLLRVRCEPGDGGGGWSCIVAGMPSGARGARVVESLRSLIISLVGLGMDGVDAIVLALAQLSNCCRLRSVIVRYIDHESGMRQQRRRLRKSFLAQQLDAVAVVFEQGQELVYPKQGRGGESAKFGPALRSGW